MIDLNFYDKIRDCLFYHENIKDVIKVQLSSCCGVPRPDILNLKDKHEQKYLEYKANGILEYVKKCDWYFSN